MSIDVRKRRLNERCRFCGAAPRKGCVNKVTGLVMPSRRHWFLVNVPRHARPVAVGALFHPGHTERDT